jgi:hypothetical protein
MNEKEMKDLIVESVELNMPEFAKAVKLATEKDGKERIILMTNTAFGISPTETALLGRAIKYAGFSKVKIEII